MGGCGGGCGGDAAAAVAAAAGTCSSGGPWRHPSYVPCQLCGGWSGPPGSGRRWLCGDAPMCAPSQHLRSADRCSPASGTPVDTPGHLWILSDRRHAQDLEMRTEKERGWVGRGDQRRKGRKSVQGRWILTQTHTKISGIHTCQTDTHKWKQMKQKQGRGKKPEREQERARWRNVRLFAIRTEWFPEGKFILFKLRMEEKEKAPVQSYFFGFILPSFILKKYQNPGV